MAVLLSSLSSSGGRGKGGCRSRFSSFAFFLSQPQFSARDARKRKRRCSYSGNMFLIVSRRSPSCYMPLFFHDQKDPPKNSIYRCYSAARRVVTRYTARTTHPGIVFVFVINLLMLFGRRRRNSIGKISPNLGRQDPPLANDSFFFHSFVSLATSSGGDDDDAPVLSSTSVAAELSLTGMLLGLAAAGW